MTPNPAAHEPDGLDDTAEMLPIEIEQRAYDTEPALTAPADTRGCCGLCGMKREGIEQIGEVEK
jgi:hypothetical protein